MGTTAYVYLGGRAWGKVPLKDLSHIFEPDVYVRIGSNRIQYDLFSSSSEGIVARYWRATA